MKYTKQISIASSPGMYDEECDDIVHNVLYKTHSMLMLPCRYTALVLK